MPRRPALPRALPAGQPCGGRRAPSALHEFTKSPLARGAVHLPELPRTHLHPQTQLSTSRCPVVRDPRHGTAPGSPGEAPPTPGAGSRTRGHLPVACHRGRGASTGRCNTPWLAARCPPSGPALSGQTAGEARPSCAGRGGLSPAAAAGASRRAPGMRSGSAGASGGGRLCSSSSNSSNGGRCLRSARAKREAPAAAARGGPAPEAWGLPAPRRHQPALGQAISSCLGERLARAPLPALPSSEEAAAAAAASQGSAGASQRLQLLHAEAAARSPAQRRPRETEEEEEGGAGGSWMLLLLLLPLRCMAGLAHGACLLQPSGAEGSATPVPVPSALPLPLHRARPLHPPLVGRPRPPRGARGSRDTHMYTGTHMYHIHTRIFLSHTHTHMYHIHTPQHLGGSEGNSWALSPARGSALP